MASRLREWWRINRPSPALDVAANLRAEINGDNLLALWAADLAPDSRRWLNKRR